MKTKRKLLEDKLDKLVKQIAFNRNPECVTCPLWAEIKPTHRGSRVMQPGHYITRGAHNVKWDMRNVYTQCSTCNLNHEYRPEVMAMYVRRVLGDEGFEQLVFDGNQSKKFSIGELENLYNELKLSLDLYYEI